MLGDLSKIVCVEVAFVDACHANSPSWVNEGMVTKRSCGGGYDGREGVSNVSFVCRDWFSVGG